jgi:hypothetical protein
VSAALYSSIGTIDPNHSNPHNLVILLTVPAEGVQSQPVQETEDAAANAVAEAEAVAVRRQLVERVVGVYVALTDDRQRVKLNAAALASLKSMDFRTGRQILDWQGTVGWALARMRRACGPCRTERRDGCIHVDRLLEAARLRNRLNYSRGLADVCTRQLGSETTRRSMSKAHRKVADQRRSAARRYIDSTAASRNSLIRTTVYADACEFFYLACSLNRETLQEVFREEAA